jgi:hypothetical protein
LLARVDTRAAKIAPAGFERVVFVTMGVSSLAAESILHLPAASLGKRPFLLDTIDPDSLRAFDELLDFDTTLFVFANKSGKLIETHSLLLYFLERLKMMGIHFPAHHFITLAEENSYLGQLAGEYDFLDSFLIPRASMVGFHRSFISIFSSRRSVALIRVICSHTRNRCAMPAVPRPQGRQTSGIARCVSGSGGNRGPGPAGVLHHRQPRPCRAPDRVSRGGKHRQEGSRNRSDLRTPVVRA